MASAATPPNPASNSDAGSNPAGAFGGLVHEALLERGRLTADPAWHVSRGELRPQDLCRYAAGRLEGTERSELEGYLSRTPWATGRIAALVRGARADARSPLARRLMAAAGEDADIDPYRTVAAALLDSMGRADLLEQQAFDGDDPLAKAAHLLARGQRQEAEAAFDGVDVADRPLARAARAISSLSDADQALAHLLGEL